MRVAATMYLAHKTYESGDGFLRSYSNDQPGCLVLEVKIPGLTGLELQEVLATQTPSPPLVFLTGHGTISIAVQAMRAEA